MSSAERFTQYAKGQPLLLSEQIQQTTYWNIFLFFPENRVWHFMQIVSVRDNLYEMSNIVFLL